MHRLVEERWTADHVSRRRSRVLRLPAATICDPAWSETAVRLVRMTNALTVPVFFPRIQRPALSICRSAPSRPPHDSAAARTAEQAREDPASRRQGARLPHPVCRAIPLLEAADYLQWRTQLLQARRDEESTPVSVFRDPFPFRGRKTPRNDHPGAWMRRRAGTRSNLFLMTRSSSNRGITWFASPMRGKFPSFFKRSAACVRFRSARPAKEPGSRLISIYSILTTFIYCLASASTMK